ncbi:nucleotide exchange factor SIL1 isoform X2 [Carassius gibelio]|uniref:nucleotide exchange factor SIL1 isoform X2 n=1 Tax=Carassius gibelio TaxID=101364 RepID=UPI002278FED4|nr:nucleotide exchange factor SIL1 isoform X2 [Carassius gibelio]
MTCDLFIRLLFIIYLRVDFDFLFVSYKILITRRIMQNKWKLGLSVALWLVSVHLVCAHKKSTSALSIKEGSDDHNKGEETLLEDEDSEDLEVFRPTDKWQTLKPVPAGSHVRLNLQTGQREVKMGEEEGLKYWRDGNRQGMMNIHSPSFTSEELKEALKKFKEGMDDPVDSKQDENAVKAQFRPIEELKKDMEELDMLVETDVQVMRRLLNQFNNTNSTTEEKIRALLDLEYLVHQVDNAQNLVSVGGMQLVINVLNSTDIRLQESAAFVLGSAVSSNPSVQVEAIEGGALQKLLTLLATQKPITVKKKVLFAVASLLRHFPFAQSHFLKLGGVQVLSELFQTSGTEPLRVRIITVLYDMITEKELMSQVGMDLIPDSSHQERLRQYAEVSLLPVLVEQGWCSLVPELLVSPEHDCREKALRTLLAMMAQCQTQYKQNPALTASLSELQKQYQELVLTEQDVGEQDGYFADILALVDTVVVKMQQV